MIICALKFTHDGTVVLLDNGKLVFSYEMEKINNNDRFSSLGVFFDEDFLKNILNENGYSLEQVDRFVIDGWGGHSDPVLESDDYPVYKARIPGSKSWDFDFELHRYGLLIKNENVLDRRFFDGLEKKPYQYSSYMHVAGHMMSAYCTSPFARRNESSFILIWDGAMFPQLFYFDIQSRSIENLGPIFHLLGYSYNGFAINYKPFNKSLLGDLSVAGKVMAYIALGKCNETALEYFRNAFDKLENSIATRENQKATSLAKLTDELMAECIIYGELNNITGEDMIATFHIFLQELILDGLKRIVSEKADYAKNLCFAGGAALNIKWNSRIRNAEIFDEVWVPPFPNDSGSAIGAACCEMFVETGKHVLDWDVYTGPFLNKISTTEYESSWNSTSCSLTELAIILHKSNKPVVFLNGRAELGPRSLGNRSILASPVTPEMKALLNNVKKREEYRPVAPICMEDYAEEIFTPGIADPHMLFDHYVKHEWRERIPAVLHLDGTARLQTVNHKENAEIYELLSEYRKLSGIPVLCNTSANFNGKGFFPSVLSAMKWGKVTLIWSEGTLYINNSDPTEMESVFNLLSIVDQPLIR